MGGRVNGVLLAAALGCGAACATAGTGETDAGLPPESTPASGEPGGADATPGSMAGGDGAPEADGDAAGIEIDPEASDFGTPPDGVSPAEGALDAAAPDGPSAADGAADGPSDVGAGDVGAMEGGAIGDATTEGGADAGACGACAAHFACGPSRYCQTATGVPAFGRVFVIVLDDTPLSVIQGSASAPYLNQLMSAYAYGTSYTTPDHPSLPNYFDLTSGNPQANLCDCQPGTTSTCTVLNCSALVGACTCPLGVSHLGDDLDVAGIPWREYAESMGAPCNPAGIDGGTLFAANHVPFLYYDDIATNAGRCQQRVRDFTDFAGDLAGTSGPLFRFSLISPNLCNDMHSDCTGDPVKQGDVWLAIQVPLLLATPGFAPGGRDVLFIVGDELPAALGSGPMPFLVVSPLAKAGPTAGAYDHSSLLATIEDGLGLPRLGNAGGSATIADVWR
jgi:phosphatidylinositol-3-phosphatase